MKLISLIIIKLIIIINVIIKFTIAQPTIVRCCHGSAVVNDKEYIGGGLTGLVGEDIWTDDFFSIDLSKPFSTLSPEKMPFNVLTNIPVKSRGHALVYANSAKGGNGMIYLFGGHRQPPEGNPIYGYNIELNAWSTISPKLPDGVIIPVNSTYKVSGVTDSNLNVVYLYDNGTMYIFDALRNFWDVGSPSPFIVIRYTAVMLNTSEIAYIGGYTGTTVIPMNQILLFNTKTSSWYMRSAMAVDSSIPSPRIGHSASIAPDGRIFIYGGINSINESDYNAPVSTPSFAVLEYVNGNFQWSSPSLYNQTTIMRIFHSSDIYEHYLIIAYGRNLTHNRLNTIDMIDISNKDSYNVVTNFRPDNYVAPPDPSKQDKSTTVIIIASACGTIGLLLLIGGIIYLIKCIRDQDRRDVIATPGGNDFRHMDYVPSTPGSIQESNFTARTSDPIIRPNDFADRRSSDPIIRPNDFANRRSSDPNIRPSDRRLSDSTTGTNDLTTITNDPYRPPMSPTSPTPPRSPRSPRSSRHYYNQNNQSY